MFRRCTKGERKCSKISGNLCTSNLSIRFAFVAQTNVGLLGLSWKFAEELVRLSFLEILIIH